MRRTFSKKVSAHRTTRLARPPPARALPVPSEHKPVTGLTSTSASPRPSFGAARLEDDQTAERDRVAKHLDKGNNRAECEDGARNQKL